MTLVVYGLRLRGSIEARYIGQTAFTPEKRLSCLLSEARAMPSPTNFALWLRANAGGLEAFEITRVGTRSEALQKEKETTAVCLALNHRLFNQWLVPAERRSATGRERAQAAA